ncbi:hypothetical protein chiPu_0021419 [Chiloscyllium punctatum]|uniref:Uncharacterized protein n=1 Tax=Chiloscyllium punctatum TaxID=137246 RepID=A0A401REU8_CHIPU|nr:hypothetical protein [Chiloscyllium punctatum]
MFRRISFLFRTRVSSKRDVSLLSLQPPGFESLQESAGCRNQNGIQVLRTGKTSPGPPNWKDISRSSELERIIIG